MDLFISVFLNGFDLLCRRVDCRGEGGRARALLGVGGCFCIDSFEARESQTAKGARAPDAHLPAPLDSFVSIRCAGAS